MKMTSLFLAFIFLVSACAPASGGKGEVITGCSETLDGMSALLEGYDVPEYFRSENPVKKGGEFDVMQYFTVLHHLSMKPGYVLDYVYSYEFLGGYPMLYVRPENQAPYATAADMDAAWADTSYLDYVQLDDTAESWFQFVVLANKANQFYLDWHANYNDTRLVCDRAAVKSIVSSLDGGFGYRISLPSRIRAALLMNLAPSVTVNTDTVEVSIVTFTLWGGFYRVKYTLSRTAPHTIIDVQETNLVPYQCGVMF